MIKNIYSKLELRVQEGKEERKIKRERDIRLELKGIKTGNKNNSQTVHIICKESGWSATAAVVRLAERVY